MTTNYKKGVGGVIASPPIHIYNVGAGWVATPQTLKEECDELNVEMNSFGQELRDSIFKPGEWTLKDGVTTTDPRYIWYTTQWRPFYQSWASFREKHQNWWSNMWGSTMEEINSYRSRLIAYRNTAASASVGFTLGSSPAPSPPKTDPVSSVGSAIKNLAWGALVVWGTVTVIKESKK